MIQNPFDHHWRLYTGSNLCEKLKKQEVAHIIIPNTGYFSTDAVTRVGFIQMPTQESKTSLTITSFGTDIGTVDNNTPFYMEVM